MFLTSLKQTCNEDLIKFSENQSAPKLENRKTSPCSPCAPNLLHVLLSRIPGYHNLCSPSIFFFILHLISEDNGAENHHHHHRHSHQLQTAVTWFQMSQRGTKKVLSSKYNMARFQLILPVPNQKSLNFISQSGEKGLVCLLGPCRPNP